MGPKERRFAQIHCLKCRNGNSTSQKGLRLMSHQACVDRVNAELLSFVKKRTHRGLAMHFLQVFSCVIGNSVLKQCSFFLNFDLCGFPQQQAAAGAAAAAAAAEKAGGGGAAAAAA